MAKPRKRRAPASRSAAPSADRQRQAQPPLYEWLIASVGAAMLASAIGYLAYYGLRHPEGRPDIFLTVLSVAPSSGGHLVLVQAENRGDGTATALRLGGELKRGEAVVEASEATIDYLPRRSQGRFGLFFRRDPAGHDLTVRVQGYAEP